MKINFHELQSQYSEYRDEINQAIQNVLDSCQFIMGEAVFNFEKKLAQFLNCNHVVSCANGTDAVMLALMSLEVKPKDEIITTPFSFIATAEVISFLGATPVFADIQADTYNLDPEKIADKITPNTRAIIPVSLYGQPADMEEINAIASTYSQKYNRKIYVIEDAAQSLGAEYKGKKSGNLSDIGCLSFFPTKPLGCYGDGGAVVVNDNLLAERIKSLREHGQTKRYNHTYIGINARLDTIQAAILQVKLKYFADEIKKREKIANYYHELLTTCDVVLPKVKEDRTSVYAQYSIRSNKRDSTVAYLKEKNIPVSIHYPKPLHLQPCFAYLSHAVGDFPIAERVAAEIMSLPMSAYLTAAEQKYIHHAIQSIGFAKSLLIEK